MNKCKILRDLMVTLDRITANGVVKGQCQYVASKLGDYCAEGTSFNAPTLDEFFEDDVTSRRVTSVVVCELDKNVEMPEELSCPVGTGTLLFALHEWTFVQIAMKRTYQAAVAGRGKEMAFGLFELRKALQDWMPGEYENIFIDA